jgi:hypothetical protein
MTLSYMAALVIALGLIYRLRAHERYRTVIEAFRRELSAEFPDIAPKITDEFASYLLKTWDKNADIVEGYLNARAVMSTYGLVDFTCPPSQQSFSNDNRRNKNIIDDYAKLKIESSNKIREMIFSSSPKSISLHFEKLNKEDIVIRMQRVASRARLPRTRHHPGRAVARSSRRLCG